MRKKNIKFNTKVLIVFLVIFIASMPLSMFVSGVKPDKPDKPKKPKKKDTSASFIIEYLSPDTDFTSIDFSGIQYYIDGELFVTTSNTIDLYFNDDSEHNVTIYFGGVTHEYIFSADISETITLATKSINSIVKWEVLGTEVVAFFDLIYFDGTSWLTIATGEYPAVFNNLVMGKYMLLEIGETYLDGIEFTIDQSTDIYTDDIILIPEQTVIDIDYIATFLGVDTPVNLTGVDWVIYASGDGGTSWIPMNSASYLAIDLSGEANGVITIYELITDGYIWKIVIGDTWNVETGITVDGLTELDIVAKSLETEFIWSFDSSPVADEEVELLWFDGIDWISVDNYTTNVLGMVIITQMLMMGTYKFEGQPEFDIVAIDDPHTESYEIGSKSLIAEFLWSSNSDPVIGMNFGLYLYNDISLSFELYGTYITDVNGLVNLTDTLPTGLWKFEDYTEFSITMLDDEITKSYFVESINIVVYTINLGLRTPAWIPFGSVESKYFYFSFFVITLILLSEQLDKSHPLISPVIKFSF